MPHESTGPGIATAAQQRRLLALVPPPVRLLLAASPPEELRGWRREAELVCLFTDVSGFTPLVETLASRGKEGLEQLRDFLNRAYESLVSTAARFGGEVLRFAGDAMTVLFEAEQSPVQALENGLRCAFELQRAMLETTARLPRGLPPLGLKVGVGAGPLSMAIVGTSRMELAVDGPALHRAIAAEHGLGSGEVGIELRGLDPWHLEALASAGELRGTVRVLKSEEQLGVLQAQIDSSRGGPGKAVNPSLGAGIPVADGDKLPAIERLAPFMLAPLYQRVLAGSMDLLHEHRRLVVLFLRFDGIDASRADQLPRLDRFFTESEAMLSRQGGFLTELDIGDKGSNLIAIFGAPVAIETPWESAGRAALELIALSREQGLTSRVGLASGPMFCGEIGARSRLQYTVFGEAINRSARLMGIAGADQVMVDPILLEELGSEFVLEALPPRPLKGFSRPVSIGRLIGAREAGAPRAVKPLVGRARELQRLTELWETSKQGHRVAVAVCGPPGIGKSRLVLEFRQRAALDGALLLEGRGRPEARTEPFSGIREVLELLLEADEHETEVIGAGEARTGGRPRSGSEKIPLFARLLELAPGGAPAAAAEPSVALQSALAVVDRLLVHRAQRGPVILLLEDLHWLDPASLELLLDQCRAPSDRALFLLVTAREADALKGCEAEVLSLEAWDRTEITRAALQVFGAKLLDRELEALLIRQSQGIPMMLLELCRHLISRGLVEVSPFDQANPVGRISDELPNSVEALMLARLDELQVETRHLLQVASCVGTEFELPLLANIAELEEAAAAQLLRPAVDDGIIRQEEGGVWSFVLPILRESVHACLSRADLRRLHGQVADELARQEGLGDPVEPGRLAYHFHLANRKKLAYLYSRRAAEQARSNGSLAEALLHLDLALELFERASIRSERTDLSELLEERFEVRLLLGNPEQAASDARRLVQLARRRQDLGTEARGWLGVARAEQDQSHYADAEAAASQALELGERIEAESIVAAAFQELGKICFFRGQFDESADHLAKALELALAHKDRIARGNVYAYLGRLHARTGRLKEAREHFAVALEWFETIGARSKQLTPLRGLASVAILAGRMDEAHELSSRALELSRQIGFRNEEATALQYLAATYRYRGDLDQAEGCFRQSIAAFHRASYVEGVASCTNNLAALLHLRHRLDEAEPLYQKALDLWEGSGNAVMRCYAVNNLAELFEDRGEAERAAARYRDGLELSQQARNPSEEVKALLGLARHARFHGNVVEARALAARGRELAAAADSADFMHQADEFLRSLPPDA